MNSASLCSLAGRYENPIPPQCLAPIDFLKIPALAGRYGYPIPPRCLAPIDSLKIPAQNYSQSTYFVELLLHFTEESDSVQK
jgi:hypothetical protein